MPAPTFTFTDRAIPIVQFGRSVNRDLGDDRWGWARWGSGKWGAKDWEPVWATATCEIHEITTDIGRGDAADRFRPGTADIVASNVTGLSELIFPPIADGPHEYVPQPPIPPEEDLQADNAATVISDGWQFTDDFHRAGPYWIFPSAWGSGVAPSAGDPDAVLPMKLLDQTMQPEMYFDTRYGTATVHDFIGNGCAQYTQVYDVSTQFIQVVVDRMSMPGSVTDGDPRSVIHLYLTMNTIDRRCVVATITYRPAWGGDDNTIEVDIWQSGPAGERVTGLSTPVVLNVGATNGQFPEPARWEYRNTQEVLLNGDVVASFFGMTAPSEGRIGFGLSYEHGERAGGVSPGPVRVREVTGGVNYDLFTDTFERDIGPGWKGGPFGSLNVTGELVVHNDGAVVDEQWYPDAHDGAYQGESLMVWRDEFVGDQYIEITIDNMSQVETVVVYAETFIELYTHWDYNDTDFITVVAGIHYLAGWGGDDNLIRWVVYWSDGADGDTLFGADINYGATEGVFPQPTTWRLESDVTGEVRFYHDGTRLGTATMPMSKVKGTHVGILERWGTGPPPPGVIRPRPTMLTSFSGGLQHPPGNEEVGCWVRIGVDHDTLGKQWFFRGFVDGLVPTYLPDRPDAVRIECIDSLGEAGRAPVVGDRLGHRFAETHIRIQQILNAASWPRKKREIHDDATFMSRPSNGKAVDMLTQIAESCGGAVYGDPVTGDVVFKGQDWQGEAVIAGAQAYITNYRPDDEEPRPRVCPVGWELSSHRSDMVTRVRYSSATSDTDEGEPIVREWRSPQAEAVYGVELYERTLLCITGERLTELAKRQLRLGSPRRYPRVEAVLLDASTAAEALDLMASTTITRPSVYQCQLRRDNEFVFNRTYLVTGIRHRILPDRWTCRLALDIASAFVEYGGRWGRAHWGVGTWGRTR
jgi:hypothetical protein